MNITKTYLTGAEAAAVLARYCALNPFSSSLRLEAAQLGHHSATLIIPQNIGLKASGGAIDAGVVMAAMNVAVSLLAESSVPGSQKWTIKDFSLSPVAHESRGALRLVAESEEPDWTSPGNKIVSIIVCVDTRSQVADVCAVGEVIVAVSS